MLLSKVSDTRRPNALTKGVIAYMQNCFSRMFSTICKKMQIGPCLAFANGERSRSTGSQSAKGN